MDLSRGEVWTVSGYGAYAGKARPGVVIQSPEYPTDSVTLCLLTTDEAPIQLRPVVAPSLQNGLERLSRLMVDKLTTVPRTKLGRRLGRLTASDEAAMDRAIITFLDLAPGRGSERNEP
jgi:mRNA interferase MazF